MAIQCRRGLKKDFDATKMLPGEWGVAIDPETANQVVYMCFAPGVVKRMGTYEDFKDLIDEATGEIKEEYLAEVERISDEAITSIEAGVASVEEAATEIATDRDQILANKDDIADLKKTSDDLAITATAHGKDITITDASNQPFRQFKMCGKSEQFTTTGAQLFNKSDVTLVSGTSIEQLASGFRISGDVRRGGCTANVQVNPQTTYYFDVDIKNNSANPNAQTDGFTPRVFIYTKNSSSGAETLKYTIPFSKKQQAIAVGEDDIIRIVFVYNWITGAALDDESGDVEFANIMLSNTANSQYEPCTGRNPSPNPEYPQAINSCGDDGSIVGKVLSRNMLKYSIPQNYTETKNGVTLTILKDGGLSVVGTNSAPQDIAFIITNADYYLPDGECAFYAYGLMNNVVIGAWNNWGPFWEVSGKKEYITISSDGVKIGTTNKCTPRVTITVRANATVNTVVYLMISVCKTLTSYEPYAEQAITVLTPDGLPGIRVESGGNYTDENGQQRVCDTVEYQDGQVAHVQRIGRKKLVPSDITGVSGLSTNDTKNYIIGGIKNVRPGIAGKRNALMCNSAKAGINQAFNVENTVFLGGSNSDTIYICVNSELAQTVDEFKDYVDTHDIEIAWELNTPITTPLTAAEAAQFAALHTYKANTIISNDAGVEMDVEYVADTETYIDQHYVPKDAYTALEERVAALEANTISNI